MPNINDTIIPKLKLAKLKKLELAFKRGQEQKLQSFIDAFPTLTHFKVVFYSEEENIIYKSLKNISNLKHLIQFVCIEIGLSSKRLCDLLNQMANNCRFLKTIGCVSKGFNNKNSDISQLLFHLKSFPALKRLILYPQILNFNNQFEKYFDFNQIFSFELFKGFSNITHLILWFHLRSTLKESILKDIDINLPKLQNLKIINQFDTTPEGVTQMADIMSRLSRLETLKLNFKSGVDFKPIEEQITEKCRKIRTIQLNSLSKISGEIINDFWLY